MDATPLPYISRPQEETLLHTFLVGRLERQRVVPRALFLCGSPGIGKRTLLRHVYASDPRLRKYRVVEIEAAMQKPADTIAPAGTRKALGTAAEVVGEGLNYALPVAGLVYSGARILAADWLFGERRPERGSSPPDYSILDTDEPVLLIVPGIDPEDVGALRRYAGLIREAYHRESLVTLLFLDDSAFFRPASSRGADHSRAEEFRGLAGLSRFLEDDRQLEVLRLCALSESQCRDVIVQLGLSTEWAKVFHQFSEGQPAELAVLWGVLQRRGVIEPAGGGRWKALGPAIAGPAWDLARDILIQLIRSRIAKDSVHEARLITGCLLAASMGTSFLPQAVAECVFAADPKRDQGERDAWEDLWFDVLEHETSEHPTLAIPRSIDGTSEILQADAREFFVYSFRDPSLLNLLRAAVRRFWREQGPNGGPAGRPQTALAEGSRVLEEWLARSFRESWRDALGFRASLLQVRNRDWEASPLEDLRRSLQLQERLQAQVEQERRQQHAGEDARGLFASLLWYAETLRELGQSQPAVEALREAKELADEQHVALSDRERWQLLSRLGSALMADGRYPQAELVLAEAWRLSSKLYGPDDPRTLTSVNAFAALLERCGRYDEAEPLFRWVLEARERVLGSEHLDTLVSVSNIAFLLMRRGHYDEAEPLFRWVLEARERVLGPEHPDTLSSVINLASLLNRRGHHYEAEPLYRRALAARERVLGPEHPDTLSSVNDLASLLDSRGHRGDAEPLYRRALEARERVLGPEHPDMLISVNNLASMLEDQGRYDEAEPLYLRALEARERVLGPEHPDTLTSVNNFASLLNSRGHHDEAEPLYRRVLEARERVLGPEHPHTLTSANNLASLLHDCGHDGEAEPLFRRVQEARERVLGPEHPDTLTSINNLAFLLERRGHLGEAEPLYRRALEACDRVLGPEHPDTLSSVKNLASLLAHQDRYDEAEPLHRRALEARERVLGPEHPETLSSVASLASLLVNQDRYDEAEPLHRRALEAREQVLGPEHPHTLVSVNNFALLLYRRGHHSEAEPLFWRAVEGHERVLGPEHPDTLSSISNLASLLESRGRHGEAEPLYRRVLEACERVLGLEHPDTLNSVCNLASLLEAQGRYDEAQSLYRRALEACERVVGPEHPEYTQYG